MKERFGDENIIKQTFRDKSVGWSSSSHCGTITTNSRQIHQAAAEDAYLRSFYSNLGLNEACFSYQFSKLPRSADITIGDFWGIGSYKPKFDGKKGTSVVIVNNEKAQRYINEVKSQFKLFESVPLEVVPKGNPNLIAPSKKHINYELF